MTKTQKQQQVWLISTTPVLSYFFTGSKIAVSVLALLGSECYPHYVLDCETEAEIYLMLYSKPVGEEGLGLDWD